MSGERPVAIIGAIAANLVIAVAKFAAAFVSGSSAMTAEGIHSVIDTGNEILLLVGIARIGLILCATASYLVVETKALLIGESANAELVADIEKLMGTKDFVVSVGRPLTMHFGPHQVLVNLDLTVRTDASARELVKNLDELEEQVRLRHPDVKRIYISPRLATPPAQHTSADQPRGGDEAKAEKGPAT